MGIALGIDVGTSRLKVLALDLSAARVVATAEARYPTRSSGPGWAEQDPQDWWRAIESACAELFGRGRRVRPAAVEAIGLSGQMHGLVALGADGVAIRPAVIWSDGRSAGEAQAIEAAIGRDELIRIAGNRAAVGFAAPTYRWLAEHDRRSIEGARWLVQPKDAVRAQLTGEVAAEVSDASGTLLLDLSRRSWSDRLCTAAGIDPALLPRLLESSAMAGRLTPAAAGALGLRPGIAVAAGAGDALAAALGLGIVADGGRLESGSSSPTELPTSLPTPQRPPRTAMVMLGTGGQVLVPGARPLVDAAGRLNAFCHAVPGEWCGAAAILSAGMSLEWALGLLGAEREDDRRRLLAAAARRAPGSGGITFHPYLSGERTPLMDPRARAAFREIRAGAGRGEIVRAVMEGVALALRSGMEVLVETITAPIDLAVVAGGGARSALWREILANALDVPIALGPTEHASPRGAALLGGVAAGAFPSMRDALEIAAAGRRIVAEPDPAQARMYRERAAAFAEAARDLPRAAPDLREG